jgi:hypothetical protein
MSYDWTSHFKAIYDFATIHYGAGHRDASTYFNAEQTAFLASIGMRPIELYDFVEDFAKSGEPDFGTVVLITAERRDYFLNIQQGKWTDHTIDMAALPPKDQSVDGIVWLPRIIPKARAKLRGEMPSDLMFDCGGDRRFFRENKVHPSDFLRMVRAAGDNDAAIIDFVKKPRAT